VKQASEDGIRPNAAVGEPYRACFAGMQDTVGACLLPH
jgi:hypothetical protein